MILSVSRRPGCACVGGGTCVVTAHALGIVRRVRKVEESLRLLFPLWSRSGARSDILCKAASLGITASAIGFWGLPATPLGSETYTYREGFGDARR